MIYLNKKDFSVLYKNPLWYIKKNLKKNCAIKNIYNIFARSMFL